MYELINDLVDQQSKKAAISKIKPASSATLRQTIFDLLSTENARVPAERRVSQHTAFTVAARSLNKTASLEAKSRFFAAYRDVASFISLAIDGNLTELSVKNVDLLPIGHPNSTRSHGMTASAYRNACARWVAADPRVDDSARELVASAYTHDIGSIEYTHATTRLAAVTAGLVPRDVIITAVTAAFSFGSGNSSAARSARAKLQWRDRLGRWIEMGRGIGFKVNLPGGAAPAIGAFVGMGSTPDTGLVQIKGDKNLPDGIYPIKSSNAEAFKAILTDKQTGGLASKLSQLLDARANIPTLDELKALRMDAPEGWTKNEDGSFKSDDNYVVKGQDGAFELFREDKNGDLGTKVGDAKGWSEVQDLANADQKSYDNFKRVASSDINKDVLPGQETDPYDNLPAGTKAFLKEQDAKEEKKLAEQEARALAHNEEVDKFKDMLEQGKDIEGRDIPEGWEVIVQKYGNGEQYVKIREFRKLVPSKDGKAQVQVIANIGSDGKILFGHTADWFNKNENGTGGYDTWQEAEAQIPRVVNWVGDSKNLLHNPENPFYKDTIPVPHPDKPDVVAELPKKTEGKPAAKNVKEKAPAEPAPIAPEETAPSEFDPANFTVPDGAYKLQVSTFEPEGRYDDSLSKDYSDDPKVVAGKFAEEDLKQGLSQALIGTKDFATQFLEDLADEPSDEDEEAPAAKSKPGPKPKKPAKSTVASGSGLLEFNSGEEFVPAETLYLALKEQGYDVDQFVADLYDSQLGQNTNSALLNNLTKEESIKAQEPSAIIERFDLDPNMYKAYHQIAAPDIASVATQQMHDAVSKPEDNEQLLKIAEEIKSMRGTQGYKKLLNDHIELAFSDNPDDQAAFRGMWGLLISIDGGATDEFEVTDFTDAVHGAITNYKGSDMAPNEFSAFMNKYGFFDELIQGKIDIAQGRTDIQDPESTAGAFYRLVAQISEPNTVELYRGISLKEGSTALDHYINEGNIVSIDPRSFSDDKATAGNFADAFVSVGGSSVIFTLPKGEGSSINLTSVSMFTDEREHLTWGDYRVAEVRKKPLTAGRYLYNVKLEKVTARDSVLDGYSSDSDQFLLTNEEVTLPAAYYTPSVESYTPQLDPDSDTPDDPLYIARAWESQDLIEVFQGGIEDGSGKATLVYPVDGGKDTVVDIEAVRDALQIQGIDTNQILSDIANTEPDVAASTNEPAPAESSVDNPIDELSNDIATEYDMQGWKKTGPQLGSNEGGFYEDADGNRYYVKTPKSDLHAQNEVLASALYRAAGIDAAEIYLASADDGKIKTISPDIVDSKQDLDEKLSDPEYLAKLQEGFAVDAWLANWDVAGLVFDNVMSDGNGDPVRVDPGGALLFRAMGAPKGSLFSGQVSELDTLRDKNMNPQSSAIFGSMTDEQQKESARKLLDITPDEIGQLVDSVVTDPKAAEKLKDTLNERRQNILDRYGLLADDTSITVQNNDMTPEEKTQAPDTPETMLDTLYGWANEYKDPIYGTYPSDAKQFDSIANQVDGVLVDYRNGDITDAQLPGVLDELYNFVDTYNWKGESDEQTQNNVSDLLEQIDAIKEKVAPTPEPSPEAPSAPETPNAPAAPGLPANAHEYKTSDGVTITIGMQVKYKKTGEVVTVTKYNSNNDSGYIYVTGESFKKPAVKSTKQLVSIDNGGGGEEAPKAPEAPSAPEPTTPEAPTPEVKTENELPEFSREGWEKSVTPDDEILGIKVDNSKRIIFDKKQKNGSSIRIAVDKSTLEDPELREGLDDFFTAIDDLHKRYPIDGLVVGINNADPDNPGIMGTTASFEDEPGQPPVITINKELLTKKQPLSVENVAAHEYGHALDPRTKEEAEKGLEDFKALMTPTFNKFPMTEYGLTSGREAFAEAFTAFYVRKYGKSYDANAPKTPYTESQKEFQIDKQWENTIKHFNIEELATQFERSPFKVEDTFDADNPATLQEDYTPEPAPKVEEPAATEYNVDFPFGENADLNKAANDLTKTFANGMPEGGEVIAVNENSGMIAVTPDGETVYIFDGKKNTSYTTEGKPDYFKPGGAGDVYKWRPLTADENTAITKKIKDNAVPYGEIPASPDDEGVGVDTVDNTTSEPTLEPPAGAVTAPDANGNVLWAGVEVTDKTGANGVITKVNKDGYAFVKFDDGTTKWRSSKTLQGTGNVKEGVSVSINKPKLSKKATGAGVAPVNVEKPSDWATSEFDNAPSVADAIKTVMDTSTPGAGMRGASAVVDSDSIEDLDVRFMHVYDENGNDGVQAKFKLTNWAAKKRIKEILAMSSDERKANGIEITNFSIDDMTIDEKGVGHVHKGASQVNTNLGYNYVIRTADGVTITIHRANKDDSTKFVSSYSAKAPKAFHNLVTIQAPASATPETIANALGQAGVTDVRPATPADARILIENRLMSIFDAQTDANLNLKEKAREASLTRIADKWGITPDDVVITTGASGRIETRLSPEGAQKIWEATGKPAAIFHNVSVPYLSGGDDVQADWLVNLFGGPQGGLLSTSTRWTEGIGTKGMSSHADVGTGGAEYVFTKPVANASAKEYGVQGTSPHILFDPLKIYQRLDFYANQMDAYGKRSKNKDVISAAKVGAYEVMFKHRMSWEDLDVVVMSPTMRSLVLGKLKAKGITQLGGRPIEEVIVIGTKQKEEGN